MKHKEREYVQAAKSLGAGHSRRIFIHILPNVSSPIIVRSSIGMGFTILTAAVLGFLGVGAQPPTPEWGNMLASARDLIGRASWVITLPGLAILVTATSVNLIGDGVRDALDPKSDG